MSRMNINLSEGQHAIISSLETITVEIGDIEIDLSAYGEGKRILALIDEKGLSFRTDNGAEIEQTLRSRPVESPANVVELPEQRPAPIPATRMQMPERAEQIAEALEEWGPLNNEELATKVGLSQVTVSQYESRLRDAGLLDEYGISTRLADGRKQWFLLPDEESAGDNTDATPSDEQPAERLI